MGRAYSLGTDFPGRRPAPTLNNHRRPATGGAPDGQGQREREGCTKFILTLMRCSLGDKNPFAPQTSRPLDSDYSGCRASGSRDAP